MKARRGRRSVIAAVALTLAAATTLHRDAYADTTQEALIKRIETLENRLARLEDRNQIEKLTYAFGYYGDKFLWDRVVDLFSSDCRIEIAGRGVYRGRKGAERLFLGAIGRGRIGLPEGRLLNHIVLQGIIDVAEDGQTARGRFRELVQVGEFQKSATWAEGTLLTAYVKENGVWKIQDLHWFATFYTPYDQGWGKAASPNNGPSKEFPPDEPQSIDYQVYPGHYVPPFHYPHPVTGEVWTEEMTRRYSSPPASQTGAQTESPTPATGPAR